MSRPGSSSSSRRSRRRCGSTSGPDYLKPLVVVALLALVLRARPSGANNQNKLIISSSGINVPKRPALIAGLNEQFRSRQNASASPLAGLKLPAPPAAASALLAAVRFGPRPSSAPSGGSGSGAPGSGPLASNSQLSLERRQQELLAANPNPNSPAGLLTRSDAPPSEQQQQQQQRQSAALHSSSSAPSQGSAGGLVQRLLAQAASQPQAGAANQQAAELESGAAPQVAGQQLAPQQQQQQQQQSYRGYSLVELEVRSDSDRRYVQDLYGNLSAALNEQAQRPQSLSVSPYVDIDFWSFKTALNDQIDIMVSPKARAFILGQLSRARIKHRVKIDDIQARLEQQQQQLQQAPASSNQAAPNANHELRGRQSAGSTPGQQQQAQSEPAHASSRPQTGELGARHEQPAGQLAGAAGLANDSLFFDNYQRLADINQYLESIVARARDVARVQVIGRSSQGRYLRVLKLGYEQQQQRQLQELDGSTNALSSGGGGGGDGDGDDTHAELAAEQLEGQQQLGAAPVPINATRILDQFFRRQQQSVKKVGSLWLDGGTHAREWISPATVLYIAFRLSDNHARCLRFFDHLRMVVGQQQQQQQQQRSARAAGPPPSRLERDLLEGINEINTSLLGANQKAAAGVRQRARSELEQRLELLAKRPQELASEHACDLQLEQLLRRYTFYIMPVLNPDGYEYSHTHNRLWRKTRSTSNHPIYRHFCLGADPNRNYDARHGSTGSSSHPCSQTYGGATPFTEPETRHQSNFVYAHRDSLKMFISFHSYSQMILLPFSHSKQLAPDHKDLESVGQAAVRAIEQTHGTQYKVGPSASILYTASGTASDWAYEKAGIKYSYTIELRDTGAYGFLLPKQQIVPTGEETFNGLLAMIQQMELNDNLLTSKSAPAGAALNGTRSQVGLAHAPDLDQLRPFGRFRPRPAQLENAIDGSNTWATPEPRPPGVRDRAPLGPAALEELDSTNNLLEDEVVALNEEEPDAGLAFEGEGELMEPTNNLSVNSALSGQSSEAAAQSAAKLLGHVYAHSASDMGQQHQQLNELQGRQTSGAAAGIRQRLHSNRHQLGLSANGRSLINSPPAPARSVSLLPRRESSNSF